MHGSEDRFEDQINVMVDEWNGAADCPYSQLVTTKMIDIACEKCQLDFRDRVYNPSVTTWTFLAQVASRDHSCRDAVSRLIAWRVAGGREPISLDTNSYCRARQRLPIGFFNSLLHQTGSAAEELSLPEWTLLGRRLRVVDGTTLTMPDTPANQAAFPQSTSQTPGVGFPIARALMIGSLATAAILDVEIGATTGKKTGESTLFRALAPRCIQKGDVVVGDREFESYRNVALVQSLEADAVMRMNASRKADFRRGKKLGPYDHVVVWKKPGFDAERYTREEYDQLPDEIVMREIRIVVEDENLRPEEITIATTLLDPQYTREEIAEVIRRRWRIETNFNAFKTHMQMAHLRTCHPDTVRKEILAHLIMYNLICTVICRAARVSEEELTPSQISHKGALQIIDAYAHRLPRTNVRIISDMLKAIASQRVGHRPNRLEPRKLKKRKGKYTYMTKPRHQERQRL
jgi:putative transposase